MPHAFLSPSGAPAWVRCNAKPWRELGRVEAASPFADEGTAAHFLMEQCLEHNVDAKEYIGNSIHVGEGPPEFRLSGQWPVNPEMVQEIQKALNYIRKIADGATIYSELQLSVAYVTREYWHRTTGAVCFKTDDGRFIDMVTREEYAEADVKPATGTTDVWVQKGRVGHCFDLKYGKGIQVYAADNEQQEMYTSAALREFDVLDEVNEVHMHIVQPRLNHFDEAVVLRGALDNRIGILERTAHRIWNAPNGEMEAVPGGKQCRFCKAQGTCEEYRNFVLETVVEGFVDLDKGFVEVSLDQAEKLLAQAFGVKPAAVDYQHNEDGSVARFVIKKPNIRPSLEAAELALPDATDERLATLMDVADMLEGFPKAVRAELERRLLLGTFTDNRYKLVEGKRGARAWNDETAVEAAMKSMRLKVDQMYNFSLISPTAAEKLLAVDFPRKWVKLQDRIHQGAGKPSVAPASDKRPALSVSIGELFEDITEEAALPVDTMEDLI